MFLEILLANHLHVMAVDFLWKLLVAQSYRDGAVTSSRPSGYTSLIQCVILCAKHLPRQMRRCTSYAQTVKLGHPQTRKGNLDISDTEMRSLSLTGKSYKSQKVPFFSIQWKNTCAFMRKILIVNLSSIFFLCCPSVCFNISNSFYCMVSMFVFRQHSFKVQNLNMNINNIWLSALLTPPVSHFHFCQNMKILGVTTNMATPEVTCIYKQLIYCI